MNLLNGKWSFHAPTEDTAKIEHLRDATISTLTTIMNYEVEIKEYGKMTLAYLVSDKFKNKRLDCHMIIVFNEKEWAMLTQSNKNLTEIDMARRLEQERELK